MSLYFCQFRAPCANPSIPDLSRKKLDDQIIASMLHAKIHYNKSALCGDIDNLLLQSFWARPGMPDQTQKKFHDLIVPSMNV